MTVSKLKDLGLDVTKKIKREKDLKGYSGKVINTLIFYTGDVNYDFG